MVISREASVRLNEVPTRNMKAYELYLKARSLPGVSGFGIGTYFGSVEKGVSLLRQAIKLDDDFSEAYFLLGDLYASLNKSDSTIYVIKEGIIRSPQSAGGYLALANYSGELKWLRRGYALDTAAGLLSYGNWFRESGYGAAAVRCFQEAARRLPNHVEPVLQLATVYNWMGVENSLQKYIALAKRLDPQSRQTLELDVFVQRFRVSPEDWIPTARKYFGDDSLGYYKDLGVAYLYARRWKEAEAAYAKTNYRDMDLGLVMLKTGRPDSARLIFRQSLDFHLTHPGTWNGNLARIYAVMGDRQKALAYYREVMQPYGFIYFFRVDPFTDFIREDPGYKKLEAHALAYVEDQLTQINDESGKPLDLGKLLERVK